MSYNKGRVTELVLELNSLLIGRFNRYHAEYFPCVVKKLYKEVHSISQKKDSGKKRCCKGSVMDVINLDKFDLEIVLDDVIGGVLFKDSGSWMWYEDDTRFDEGERPNLDQDVNESFSDFIKRVLIYEVEKEDREHCEKIIATNYIIHCGS